MGGVPDDPAAGGPREWLALPGGGIRPVVSVPGAGGIAELLAYGAWLARLRPARRWRRASPGFGRAGGGAGRAGARNAWPSSGNRPAFSPAGLGGCCPAAIRSCPARTPPRRTGHRRWDEGR